MLVICEQCNQAIRDPKCWKDNFSGTQFFHDDCIEQYIIENEIDEVEIQFKERTNEAVNQYKWENYKYTDTEEIF